MGSHIVDWMPNGQESDQTVALGEFTASNHMSVTNAMAAHALDLLAQMVAVGGRATDAARFAAESASLEVRGREEPVRVVVVMMGLLRRVEHDVPTTMKEKTESLLALFHPLLASAAQAAIVTHMWNGTAFCDGVCSEVGGNSRMMTNMFLLAFGMVPAANIPAAWGVVADWGIEKIGDYGAFWWLMAISSGYYAPYYVTPDDGSALLHALTKCDQDSWCSGLRDDNLTMTRESWHDGTYSHGWGTGAIVGVTWGILGVHETSPGWATFLVAPKLGTLTHAAGTVPTIRGFINVTATPGAVDVHVPCNSRARLCAPRSAADTGPFTAAAFTLLLDGVEVAAPTLEGGHLCVPDDLGCGAHGAPRQLRVQPRHHAPLGA